MSSFSQIQLADYVRRLIGNQSVRDVAAKADVSPAALYNLLAEKAVPQAATLKKLAAVLQADEARLLYLAGYLREIPTDYLDQRAAQLAERTTKLPPRIRTIALDAMEAQFEAILRTAALNDLSEDNAAALTQVDVTADLNTWNEQEPPETENLVAVAATIIQAYDTYMREGGQPMGDKKDDTAAQKLAEAVLEMIRKNAEAVEKAINKSQSRPQQVRLADQA